MSSRPIKPGLPRQRLIRYKYGPKTDSSSFSSLEAPTRSRRCPSNQFSSRYLTSSWWQAMVSRPRTQKRRRAFPITEDLSFEYQNRGRCRTAQSCCPATPSILVLERQVFPVLGLIAGWNRGNRIRHDVCSDPECKSVIGPDATT